MIFLREDLSQDRLLTLCLNILELARSCIDFWKSAWAIQSLLTKFFCLQEHWLSTLWDLHFQEPAKNLPGYCFPWNLQYNLQSQFGWAKLRLPKHPNHLLFKNILTSFLKQTRIYKAFRPKVRCAHLFLIRPRVHIGFKLSVKVSRISSSIAWTKLPRVKNLLSQRMSLLTFQLSIRNFILLWKIILILRLVFFIRRNTQRLVFLLNNFAFIIKKLNLFLIGNIIISSFLIFIIHKELTWNIHLFIPS